MFTDMDPFSLTMLAVLIVGAGLVITLAIIRATMRGEDMDDDI
jgi:hypothetical protein